MVKASRADGLFELVAGVVLLKASRADGLFELVKGVVLLKSSKAAGFLELDEGGVILELCAGVGLVKRLSLVLEAGVVRARMSSLFGLLEAGWKRLGLRRRGVVAGVLVRSIEFFVRSLRSCLVSSGLAFFVVAGSDDVEDASTVVVVSAEVVLVVVLEVPCDVPLDVNPLTPSILSKGISMILSTLKPSTVTVGRTGAMVVVGPSCSSSLSSPSSLAPSGAS